MTTKVVKWGSNDGQITKSELSNGRRAKLLPSVAEFSYDWLQFEDYLGNVGGIHSPSLQFSEVGTIMRTIRAGSRYEFYTRRLPP